MAIAKMTKIMVVSHRDQAAKLLEDVQNVGIMQVLDAQRAMVTKEWPELMTNGAKYKDIEDLLDKLEKSIEFLKEHTDQKELPSALSPLVVVDKTKYADIVSSDNAMAILEKAQKCQANIEENNSKIEHIENTLAWLKPWKNLDANVEEINSSKTSSIIAGLINKQKLAGIDSELAEAGAVIEVISEDKMQKACLIACLSENSSQIVKLLRGADFDNYNFEGFTGKVKDIIAENQTQLEEIQSQNEELNKQAADIAKERVSLQVMFDHYENLHNRQLTRVNAPATEHTVLFEGWIQKRHLKQLQEIVSKYDASNIGEIQPGQDEEPPVDIINPRAIRPFEVITRLYGMPQYFELDPTAILAPFFIIFFGLCLADAGYGILVTIFSIYMLRKVQGDKKLLWLIGICSVATIGTGALTGGWFGDGAQQLATAFGWDWLATARQKMLWFDPLSEPMMFFTLSLVLGYIHIMVGLFAGFIHKLRRNEMMSAVFDFLVWIVMLNLITASLFGEKVGISENVRSILLKSAIVPAACILFLSQREGGIGARIGMGAYNLFSTIFYLGDVLSYLRLMALGMVGGGLAMAINVIASTVGDSLVGKLVLVPLILIGGHLFNIALSALGAFVHTLRLQFVEFFPKFMEGGGRDFTPLKEKYRYVYIQNENTL